VVPTALVAGLGEDLPEGCPPPEPAVAHREELRGETPLAQVAQDAGQDSVLSRYPRPIARSSLAPSSRAPMTTKRQDVSSSSPASAQVAFRRTIVEADSGAFSPRNCRNAGSKSPVLEALEIEPREEALGLEA